MSKYQEIECKYELRNIDEVVHRLKELDALHREKDVFQSDTYYVPPHRDFFETDIVSEWFRIRETNEDNTLNYKRWLPLGAKEQTHCEEYETSISDVFALKKILSYLDFISIIKVEKIRNTWEYRNTLISIDVVTGLGVFIELEYALQVKQSEIAKVFSLFEEILEEINASVAERDKRGYPYQLLKRKKRTEG